MFALILALGLGLRLFVFVRNPSFWIDESMLALTMVDRTVPELLTPLDLNQSAPVGFLLLAKGSIRLFGSSELALRLPALLAGVASLGLFLPLARRLLPSTGDWLALLLFACSPFLVGYSAEFKQYGLDAAMALALWLLVPADWRPESSSRRILGLAVVGSLSLWLSHPALFVVGGLGLALILDAVQRRDRTAFLMRCLLGLVWVTSFAGNYWLILSQTEENTELRQYWAGKFAPMPPTQLGDLAWYVHHLLEFFERPGGFAAMGFGGGGLAAFCAVIGGIQLGRQDHRWLVALIAPLGLALAASAVGKYPFAGRLLLFAVPGVLLLVALGANTIMERLAGSIRLIGLLIVGLLVVSPVAECWSQLKRPMHAEQTRELARHLRMSWQPEDQLYLSPGAAPGFAWALRGQPIPTEAITLGRVLRPGDRLMAEDFQPLLGSPRVWVLVAHRPSTEVAALETWFQSLGRCEEVIRGADATLFRYDLSGARIGLLDPRLSP